MLFKGKKRSDAEKDALLKTIEKLTQEIESLTQDRAPAAELPHLLDAGRGGGASLMAGGRSLQ